VSTFSGRLQIGDSGQTTTFHLQTSGGVMSTVVTAGQRYDPCWLSDNNNNNNNTIFPCIFI